MSFQIEVFKLSDGNVTVMVELSQFYNEFKVGMWSGDAVAELTMVGTDQIIRREHFYSSLINGEGESLKSSWRPAPSQGGAEGALANATVRLFGDPSFVDGLLKTSTTRAALAPSAHPVTIASGSRLRGRLRLRLQKRRHRAIQRVGDGAQEFGFHFLDHVIRRDDLHAGVEHALFDLRHGLVEPI